MFKKIFYYTISALSIVFFIFALVIIIVGTISQRNNSMVKLFGYSYSVVATDSMEPTIMVGEVIIAKAKPYEDVEKGDIIVFFSEEYQEYFVHRVFEIAGNGDLITKGDNPDAPVDEAPVTEENYFGNVIRHGAFLHMGDLVLKYRNVVFSLIIAIFAFIIIKETLNIIKQSKSKNDEEAQTRLEKERLGKLTEAKEKIRQEIIEELEKEKQKNAK